MHKPLSYKIHACGEGTQTVYRFENLFGASVIKDTPFNHGFLAELAFLRFKDANDVRGRLCVPDTYEDSVKPYLTMQMVEEFLDQIEALDPNAVYTLA